MSQIADQFIYPTIGCTVPLPDYRELVTVTDNCGIKIYVQNPGVGFIISSTVNVTLTVTDYAGNSDQIIFKVTPKDTIKPVFHINPLLTYSWDTITKIYNLGDRMISQMMANEKIVGPIGNYNESDSGLYFKDVNGYNIIPYPRLYIDYYTDKAMFIYSSPGHALTGKGIRRWDFIEPQFKIDTIN
jgi:hypothetical protein